MLRTVISFLPGITCLFWIALNPLLRKRDNGFRAFQLLLACIGLATLSEAGIPSENSTVMLSCYLSRQFFALNVIPVVLIFIRSLTSDDSIRVSAPIWFAIPISILFAEIILVALCGADAFISCISNISGLSALGDDKAERLIIFCTVWSYYPILALQFCVFMVRIIKEIRRNTSPQLFNCQAMVIVFLLLETAGLFDSRITRIVTPTACAMLSAILFFSSYYGLYPTVEGVTIRDIIGNIRSGMTTYPSGLYNTRNPERTDNHGLNGDSIQNDSNINQQSSQQDSGNPQIMREPSSILNDVRQTQADEDYLRIRFEDLIVTEQLFLRQGIRISDIASMLDSNRTYISRLVNNTYNMSFSDYINTLRIDYAEQYLLHHKDAKQSDIAAACGFTTASAFNNVFKKITGVTPKIWLATRS